MFFNQTCMKNKLYALINQNRLYLNKTSYISRTYTIYSRQKFIFHKLRSENKKEKKPYPKLWRVVSWWYYLWFRYWTLKQTLFLIPFKMNHAILDFEFTWARIFKKTRFRAFFAWISVTPTKTTQQLLRFRSMALHHTIVLGTYFLKWFVFIGLFVSMKNNFDF